MEGQSFEAEEGSPGQPWERTQMVSYPYPSVGTSLLIELKYDIGNTFGRVGVMLKDWSSTVGRDIDIEDNYSHEVLRREGQLSTIVHLFVVFIYFVLLPYFIN